MYLASGQIGLVAFVFLAVAIVLHEGLAARARADNRP